MVLGNPGVNSRPMRSENTIALVTMIGYANLLTWIIIIDSHMTSAIIASTACYSTLISYSDYNGIAQSRLLISKKEIPSSGFTPTPPLIGILPRIIKCREYFILSGL